MRTACNLLEHALAVERQVAVLGASRFIDRLFRGDASLWGRDLAARRLIRNRLGWLCAPERMLRLVPRLDAFARGVRQEGIRHVLLLGMGGSSLSVEVFGSVFPAPPGFPGITLLDSTVPSAVRRVEAALDLSKTLVVVSSKSGTTGETIALQAYFWSRARRLLGRGAARRFAAITDPGSPLAEEASARGYRGVFLNPPDVGGRYSARSYFGLVPAALGGVDIGTLLRRAAAMLERCSPGVLAAENPGLALGAALGVLARHRRDKIVLLIDPALKSYGLWIEQLLAESTGKGGRGLVPVVARGALSALRRELAGQDRAAVGVVLERSRGARAIQSLLEAAGRGRAGGTPGILLTLRDRHDLGASMLQWEIATAVCGAVLGVNPFDEPNVAESKWNTEALLEEHAATGRFGEEEPAFVEGPARVYLGALPRPAGARLAGALRSLLSRARRGDYLSVLAYVDPGDRVLASSLERLRAGLASRTGLATTAGYGPRYLHSTGQLHKGGPGTGLFIEVVPDDAADPAIPGRPFDFEAFKQAQALGDHRALRRRNRRVLRVRYAGGARAAVRAILRALRSQAAPARISRGHGAPRSHARRGGAGRHTRRRAR
ncbi:MAG: glucose-6-phosphate isomerase [Acidobacteria bacterium]|nr:glucose-6-phosphate isomerase [Acidobacteriota bacterium]